MASGDPTDPEGELVGPLLPPERGRPASIADQLDDDIPF